ncbi:MAG: acyl-CoA dehydrogenase family protein, partial [Solirubrobacteraceae bacterium]
MVDFTLTDEQKALREMAHDFAAKEMRSVAWECDKDGAWPAEVLKKAFDLGLMNSHISEEYGGPGASYLDGVLIEEEIGWGCSGIGTSLAANGLALAPLVLGGSEALKQQILGHVTSEPIFASFCLTEPDAGSDVSGMRTKAVRKGDKYVINGSKCFITNGSHASYFTVYAKTDTDAGHRGISAFMVPKDDTITVDKKEDKMGQRASDTATISFNETEIPAQNLIGAAHPGFPLALLPLSPPLPFFSSLSFFLSLSSFSF